MRSSFGAGRSPRSRGLRIVRACASISTPRKWRRLNSFHSDTPTGAWKVTSPLRACTALISAVMSEKPASTFGLRRICA